MGKLITMEIHELKDFMDQRFCDLNKRFDKVEKKVDSHDHWLWFLKGAWTLLTIIVSAVGIKLHWN